jgi:hypothetical protein
MILFFDAIQPISALRRLDLQASAGCDDAKLGLRADPEYVMGHAEIVASTAATERRYAIVEDGVLSVGIGSGAVDVRCGRRWPQDFIIIIRSDDHRALGPVVYSWRAAACRGPRARGV